MLALSKGRLTMPEQMQLTFEGPLELLTVEEIYSTVSAELLIRLSEDRRIERKPPGHHPDALGEYFSMWANTSPEGGIIVIGQHDNGQLLGCSSLTPHQLNRIEKTGMDFCPDAKFASKRVEVLNPEGQRDFVVVFRVYYRPDRVVKTVSQAAFARIGDSKKKLSDHEIRELEIDKGQIEFELEPCGLNYPDDFDLQLIKQFIGRFSGMRGLSSHSDAEILSLAHLGKKGGPKGFSPNKACALLFAHDPRQIFPGAFIRFLRFEGEVEGSGEKFNAVKDIWLDGNLPNQIAKVENVLDGQLREFSRLGQDSKFYTAPEYPKPAWYELVVNACVHRSYGMRNMNIFVKMFADRLEVISPGGFPPLVTPENIYDIHQPRNPYLMEALFYLDLVKCANEGARRIRDTMADMNLPQPEFKQTQAASHANVRAILRNNIKERAVWVDSEVSSIVGERILKSLSQHEQRAINFAAQYGAVSVSEVQRLTGRTWPSAKKLLVGLVDKGILDHKVRAKLDRDPQARFILRKGVMK
jgi:ATP-dependent DNA helicase RecG